MKAFIGVLFLLIAMLLGIAVGAINLSYTTVCSDISQLFLTGTSPTTNQVILYEIRTPRVLFAAMAGSILSLVGLLMQTISHNALADPYILGISSGASAGAVAVIVFGLSLAMPGYSIYVGAFLGALLATLSILWLQGKNTDAMRLVLMGIGISAIFSAITLFIIYGAPNEALVRSAMFWILGSFSAVQWRSIPPALIVLVCLITYIYLYRHTLDVLLLGPKDAALLGVSISTLYRTIIVVSSLAIGILVSLSGVIGFVGLIVPHIARRLTTPRHGAMLVYTLLIGAILMVLADIAARVLYRPQELPIGVVTALLGAPLFMYFIYKQYGDS